MRFYSTVSRQDRKLRLDKGNLSHNTRGKNKISRNYRNAQLRDVKSFYQWCRGRDSNPHAHNWAGDFKSPVSAVPPPRPGLVRL